ncbi:MAG: prolipoprotein diacylglyceryl transferase [Oscillospiraceae bacterium]|nr:prolipoprotein diacylglyceryl transferase [Oscillospiraceae bacterium]
MTYPAISFPMLGEGFLINPSTHFTILGKSIYWYGVIIAIGFVLAVTYGLKRSKDFSLTQDNILDVLLIAAPAGIIGARLYYVVFNPGDYFGAGKWGNIIKIWEGGLAIYGGILFAVLAIILVCKIKKIVVFNLLDVTSLGFLIGRCIGRWGNFMNREAFGRDTTVFCRMGLHFADGSIRYVHPTFLYESLWNLLGFILLHRISKKHRRFSGQIFLLYLDWYGLGRFFIEGLRTDSLYLGQSGIRVSQLMAAVCFILSVILYLYCIKSGRSIRKEQANHPPEEILTDTPIMSDTENANQSECLSQEVVIGTKEDSNHE